MTVSYLSTSTPSGWNISLSPAVLLIRFRVADSWCGPCKMLSPVLERLTHDATIKSGSGRPLDLVTIDTDVEGDLAIQHNVCDSSFPELLGHCTAEQSQIFRRYALSRP